jgi:hypothetical protein
LYRANTDNSVENVSAAHVQQADASQQHHSPNESNHQAPNIEAGGSRETEKAKKQFTDKSAEDADDDIGGRTAATLHHSARQPSGKRPSNDPSDQSYRLHDGFGFLLINVDYAQYERN